MRGSCVLQNDGVNVEVTTTSEQVMLCITSDGKTSISGQYGVSIDASGGDNRVWQDILPERIMIEDWEFKLPLAIALKTKGNVFGRKLQLKLGACSDQCKLVVFDFYVPKSSPVASSKLSCGQA